MQLLNTIGADAVGIIAASTRYSVLPLCSATARSRWFRVIEASDLHGGAPFQRGRNSIRALTPLTVPNPTTLANLAFGYTRPSIKGFNKTAWSQCDQLAVSVLNGAPLQRVRSSDTPFTARAFFNPAALAVSKNRQPTSLELGLAKSHSDCVNGDGAANQAQFESPPDSPVSSSYSPLPSSEDSEEEQQTQTSMPELPVAAASSTPPATASVESQDSHSEDDTDSDTAGWNQWWASDAHYEREQERTDRVVRITSEAHAELEKALPNSCPAFEAVLQFVEWTLLNNAHGQLLSIDMHLHQRVMDEFLVRGAAQPTEGARLDNDS